MSSLDFPSGVTREARNQAFWAPCCGEAATARQCWWRILGLPNAPSQPAQATGPRSPRQVWCPGLDLNQHGLAATGPSSQRVYQFRHLGNYYDLVVSTPTTIETTRNTTAV